MVDGYVNRLEDARARVESLRSALSVVVTVEEAGHSIVPESAVGPAAAIPTMELAIYEALAKIELKCAQSYAQAYLDLADTARVSWIGTAHQVREALATTLRTLAPDDQVKAEKWVKPESQDGRPTQKQRVRYILQRRGAGNTEREVVEQVDLIEERVANIVRSTYARASNAAHAGTERKEAIRILRYFEAFAHDLLYLD